MSNKKFETYQSLYKRLSGLLIIIAQAIIFIHIWFEKFNILKSNSFNGKGNILMIFLYLIVQFFLIYAFGGFKIGYHKSLNVILSQVIAIIISDLLFWCQIILMVGKTNTLLKIWESILFLCMTDIICCIILTSILTFIYNRLFPPYKMLIIHGYYKNELRRKMNTRRDKYQICAEISITHTMEYIKNNIKQYDAVLLNDIPSKKKNEILKYCFQNSIRVYFTPKISDIIIKGADEVDLFDSPLFLCQNIGLTFEQRFLKRSMDILMSLIGLILTFPIILIVGVCIKLYDHGPIFFTQKRCFLNIKIFIIYKLRSMVENTDINQDLKPAVDHDDRITPIGRLIRKTRIDELPQLLNVLKGDMSIVGPRPEHIEHVKKYTKDIPEFSYRLKVKGGLTGYAQVYGKYNTSAYDKLKMDLKYIVNYSLLLDLQIILMTIKVIFTKDSTEGFPEQNINKAEQKDVM